MHLLKSLAIFVATWPFVPAFAEAGKTYFGHLDGMPHSAVMIGIFSGKVDFTVFGRNGADEDQFGGRCFDVELRNGAYACNGDGMRLAGTVGRDSTTGEWSKNGRNYRFTAWQTDPPPETASSNGLPLWLPPSEPGPTKFEIRIYSGESLDYSFAPFEFNTRVTSALLQEAKTFSEQTTTFKGQIISNPPEFPSRRTYYAKFSSVFHEYWLDTTQLDPNREHTVDLRFSGYQEKIEKGKTVYRVPFEETKKVMFYPGRDVNIEYVRSAFNINMQTPHERSSFYATQSKTGVPKVSSPVSTTLRMTLPVDAQVFIDGQASAGQNGRTERVIQTPPLQPGITYSYRVGARVIRNGRMESEERNVLFRAGQTVTLNLLSAFSYPLLVFNRESPIWPPSPETITPSWSAPRRGDGYSGRIH